MKIPSEAELIELEDWLSYQFREIDEHDNFFRHPRLSEDGAIERIKNLIDITRAQTAPIPPMPPRSHPPRTVKPEPAPKARPKRKKSPKQLGKSYKIESGFFVSIIKKISESVSLVSWRGISFEIENKFLASAAYSD